MGEWGKQPRTAVERSAGKRGVTTRGAAEQGPRGEKYEIKEWVRIVESETQDEDQY